MNEASNSKLDFILTLQRILGLHSFTSEGLFSLRLSVYSAIVLFCFTVFSFILDAFMYPLRLAAMTAVGTPKFGVVAGLIDTGRLILLISSLASHLLVTVISRRRFQNLYKDQITKFAASTRKQIFITLMIISSRLSIFAYVMIRHAAIFRRYVNLTFEISVAVGSYGLSLIVLQYCIVLQNVTFHTQETLSQLTTSCNSLFPFSLIDVLLRKHSYVLRFMATVGHLYGWQLTLSISYVFLEFTVNLYYTIYVCLVEMFSHEFQMLHLLYFTQNMLRAYFLGHLLAVIADATTKAVESIDAFYKELFRMMRESQTLCSNKKLCLYVSMRKTVNFTACGFFNLGYPLITSIIAAATTYLVILVQFSIPQP